MKHIIILSLLTLFFFSCNEEATTEEAQLINHIDSAKLKQGLWIRKIGSNIIDSMNYVDDKLHGSYKSYFKSGELKYSGEYENGSKKGKWLSFNKGIIVSEEVERGINNDSVRHELGYYLTPEFFSYVKLYDYNSGLLKKEGIVLYSDDWQSDTSKEHGKWVYYNENGDIVDIKNFEYGRVINQNTP